MSLRQAAGALAGRLMMASDRYRRQMQHRGIVVAFHRVNDELRDGGLTRTTRDFDRFLRFFRTYFDVIPLGQFIDRLESGAPLAGSLSITFDDGYRGNFDYAAPILRRHGLPCTFFVVTRFLGTDIVPWWDRSHSKQPGWMTWDHVRTLSAEGFDIGAHTQNHVDLGTVSSEEARGEIAGSRDDILRETGVLPVHFAYPYGQPANMVERNREIVRNEGFRCCCSCHGGITADGLDPFYLPRIPIVPWFSNPDQFAFEVLRGKV